MTGPVEASRDPYAPRPIDQPAPVPLEPSADLSVLDEAKIIAAPDDPADRAAWRAALHRWRTEARERTAYDGSDYADPATRWAGTAWNVAMVWLWDEAVRDWDRERFDAARLLAAYAPFGGLDAVVLWHAYPVIGVDPRNQFDWYDVPAVDTLVADLHVRGVKVFLDYNPWDVGTRRGDLGDAGALAEIVERLGADGVFLDTLKQGDPWLVERLSQLRPKPVFEGESRVPLARIGDHQASWAQWFADSATPGVLRARWFERRHMMHHTRRWNRDHRDELRSAWVNGAGVLIWDVVFGVLVDWELRDQHALRRMRAVYSCLGRWLTDGAWEPLTELAPEATAAGIAGSRWSLDGCELFTLANPTARSYDGPLLTDRADGAGDTLVLGDGTLPAGGIAGLLRVPEGAAAPAGLDGLVADNASDPAPVAGAAERRSPQRVEPTPAYGPAAHGAVRPEPGRHRLRLTWRQRETGLYEAASYVDDWKPLPPRLHQLREGERDVQIGPVAVDAVEVSNADYAAFLADSGYRPAVADRHVRLWRDGAPEPGTEQEPVRYVDLADARAFARWRGARLPTEHEWQAAAQMQGFRRGEPKVWAWTESEHRDGRTRWCVLKGGSWFTAEGSEWYVDGGPRDPSWAVRLLLTQAGTGRSSCIGFRCAVDLEPEEMRR